MLHVRDEKMRELMYGGTENIVLGNGLAPGLVEVHMGVSAGRISCNAAASIVAVRLLPRKRDLPIVQAKLRAPLHESALEQLEVLAGGLKRGEV